MWFSSANANARFREIKANAKHPHQASIVEIKIQTVFRQLLIKCIQIKRRIFDESDP